MQKLIELLNEYRKEKGEKNLNEFEVSQTLDSLNYLRLFIKWLVENDKIDIVKVYENLTNYEIEIRIRAVKELLENNEEDTIAYLKLLMLLSISDTLIEDLISYLK